MELKIIDKNIQFDIQGPIISSLFRFVLKNITGDVVQSDY